jgi:hypothetical protein
VPTTRAPSTATPTTAIDAATTGATNPGAPPPADAAAAKMVKLSIDSSPDGATVIGPDGDELGETPLSTEWPSSTEPVSFTLTLRGYRDKRIELDVTQNVATRVPLTKVRATSSKSGQPRKDVNGMTGKDGLERPE